MDYFDSEKNVIDYIKMVDGYHVTELINELRPYLKEGTTVLEIGMGPGVDLEILAKYYKVTGSDSSKIFVDRYKKRKPDADEPKIARAKLPQGREVIGIIEQRLGGNKMRVNCLDGKSRICRVPGRLRRRLWLRPDDVVIVEPWELDNTKGDILLKYRINQIEWLKKHGFLKEEKSEF